MKDINHTTKSTINKILDEYAGRILVYDEIARRQRHNPDRLVEDKRHAKTITKRLILCALTAEAQPYAYNIVTGTKEDAVPIKAINKLFMDEEE